MKYIYFAGIAAILYTGSTITAQTFIHFTINQDTVVTADAGAGDIICPGATANLLAVAGGGNGSYTYQWSPSGTVTSPTDANTSANPAATTTYFLLVTDGNQCTETDSVMISLPALPLVVDGGNGMFLCSVEPANITATGSGGYGSTVYNWNPSSTLSDSTSLVTTANPTITTTYYILATDSNHCTATDSITISLPSSPLVVDAGSGTTICPGTGVNIVATGSGGYGSTVYDWSPGVTLSDTIHLSTTANPLITTTYYISATDVNSCMATDSITITVLDCSGIENASDGSPSILIYPNPSTGIFNIGLENITGSTDNYMMIYTMTGDIIYQRNFAEAGNYSIQLPDAAKGIYMMVLYSSGRFVQSQKMIIQ
jgi:hypothetical protein